MTSWTGMWCWTWSVWTGLPERLCAEPAGRRAGGQLPDRAPGVSDPVPGGLRQDRDGVPSGGESLRRRGAHPGGAVHQDRPQDREDAVLPRRAGRRPAGPGWPRSGSRRSTRTCSPAPNATLPTASRGSPFTRPTAASPATTSTSGMTTSGRRSSRSAPTSPTRPRSGSTGTSGPNARPPTPGSGSPSCPTGSPPPTIPPGCRRSATGSARPPSRRSPNAGSRSCRCR